MKSQNQGKYGEDLAVSFLQKRGFEILERNYRNRKGEIDVIALLKNELLVFIEVKYRSQVDYGHPEAFVSKRQADIIVHTAEEYIYSINWKRDIRFDIISIFKGQISHIQDAFY